jgi:CO/xanthine dehydrogenase Mo-binding subunit
MAGFEGVRLVGTESGRLLGASLRRIEGQAKVTGAAQYVDDFSLPGMLHGAVVRSKVARGKVKDVVFGSGVDWSEFTIVTARDIPGRNLVACIVEDQPCLVAERINHPEEAIVLLAHPDREELRRAVGLVEVVVEAEPAVLTLDASVKAKEIIYGKDNCLKKFSIEKGDVSKVWKKAWKIVEGEYRTGAQEQLYLETNGVVAVANASEGVTVWGSLQCPYYVQKALIVAMGEPAERVRVVQLETGGGFGGKEDFPSILAIHASLLAHKSGKPVKLILDRREDLAATTKRHPSRTQHRTAIDKSGKILAMDIDFVLDGGAYATLSSVVVSRGGLHAAGVYHSPNVRIHARAVATNTPPNGAFRGFGAPQSLFAVERHMEKVARAARLSPQEFRRRNAVRTGETTATGQIVRDAVDVSALIDKALAESQFEKKRLQYDKHNSKNLVKKGIGLSVFLHGAGFTGSGESYLASVAGVEGTSDGKVRALAANTEIGQGKNTVFTQIVADALEVEAALVEVAQPDTRYVPNSGPTVASRSTMIVGKLLEGAAIGLRQTLIQSGLLRKPYSSEQFSGAISAYVKRFGSLKSYTEFKAPAHINWDDATYRGDAYSTFAWAVYVAEVKVDTRTYEASVMDFYALQEIGKVVNPVLAAGQIEGGVAQGIGFALYEDVVMKNGRMANNQLTNYIIPTALDTPPIRVAFAEVACPWGPGGAKGIGELPLDGPAPAIINAVEHAIGVNVDVIPATPEVIMSCMEVRNGKRRK